MKIHSIFSTILFAVILSLITFAMPKVLLAFLLCTSTLFIMYPEAWEEEIEFVRKWLHSFAQLVDDLCHTLTGGK